jgi:thiamine-monophosphate kinase
VIGVVFADGRLVRPPSRIEEGKRLARVATAMCDISDGLVKDAGHIARRSGCRIVLELDRVPLGAQSLLADVAFGEDYELLVTTPDPLGFTVIGRCEEGSGVDVIGGEDAVLPDGWEHFR